MPHYTFIAEDSAWVRRLLPGETEAVCEICSQVQDENGERIRRYAEGLYAYAHESCWRHKERTAYRPLTCSVYTASGSVCRKPARRVAGNGALIATGVCDDCFLNYSRVRGREWAEQEFPKIAFKEPYAMTAWQRLMQLDPV